MHHTFLLCVILIVPSIGLASENSFPALIFNVSFLQSPDANRSSWQKLIGRHETLNGSVDYACPTIQQWISTRNIMYYHAFVTCSQIPLDRPVTDSTVLHLYFDANLFATSAEVSRCHAGFVEEMKNILQPDRHSSPTSNELINVTVFRSTNYLSKYQVHFEHHELRDGHSSNIQWDLMRDLISSWEPLMPVRIITAELGHRSVFYLYFWEEAMDQLAQSLLDIWIKDHGDRANTNLQIPNGRCYITKIFDLHIARNIYQTHDKHISTVSKACANPKEETLLTVVGVGDWEPSPGITKIRDDWEHAIKGIREDPFTLIETALARRPGSSRTGLTIAGYAFYRGSESQAAKLLDNVLDQLENLKYGFTSSKSILIYQMACTTYEIAIPVVELHVEANVARTSVQSILGDFTEMNSTAYDLFTQHIVNVVRRQLVLLGLQEIIQIRLEHVRPAGPKLAVSLTVVLDILEYAVVHGVTTNGNLARYIATLQIPKDQNDASLNIFLTAATIRDIRATCPYLERHYPKILAVWPENSTVDKVMVPHITIQNPVIQVSSGQGTPNNTQTEGQSSRKFAVYLTYMPEERQS